MVYCISNKKYQPDIFSGYFEVIFGQWGPKVELLPITMLNHFLVAIDASKSESYWKQGKLKKQMIKILKKVTNKSENENKAEEELVGYLYNIDYGSKHEFYNNWLI